MLAMKMVTWSSTRLGGRASSLLMKMLLTLLLLLLLLLMRMIGIRHAETALRRVTAVISHFAGFIGDASSYCLFVAEAAQFAGATNWVVVNRRSIGMNIIRVCRVQGRAATRLGSTVAQHLMRSTAAAAICRRSTSDCGSGLLFAVGHGHAFVVSFKDG